MSVSKTPQGTYRAKVRDARGRQITKTFRLKADARAWERQRLQERDAGDLVGTGRLTVAQWADHWLAGARNLNDVSVATYRKSLNVILPVLGDYKLAELTPDRIDDFLTAQTGEYAPSTVHRFYRTIHRLCATALRRGHLGANPADLVDPPRVPRKEMLFLTSPQVEQLADAIDARYRAFILVAGYGGLRWGEMQALRASDIYDNEITVIKQLDSVDLKTQRSRRRVVLPASVGDELAAHLDTYPGEWVFTRPDGQPLSHSSFNNNRFKPALEAAGLDRRLTIHSLRHSAIAAWIRSGAHPKLVADMAGHSGISVTMDRYGHLFPAAHADLAGAVDELRKSGGRRLKAV